MAKSFHTLSAWPFLVKKTYDGTLLEYKRKGLTGILHAIWRVTLVATRYQQHQRLISVLENEATAAVLDRFPRLAYRYTLPYISTAIPWSRRLDMLVGHYEFVNRHIAKDVFNKVLQEDLVVWHSQLESNCIDMLLTGPCPSTCHREGDLHLKIRINGQTLFRVAFSIVPLKTFNFDKRHAENGHAIFIGHIQGSASIKHLLKYATNLCKDISPQDLLMHALAGLGQGWNIDTLVGTANANNICRKDSTFEYDALWERYGGVPNQDGDYVLRMPFPEKPIELIASKHRRRNQDKRAFKAELRTAVTRYMALWTKAPCR